jgi:serine-type D-Ala-D-Ala carboxypeptidase (penicillin-binding protein 5/6)
VVPSPAPRSRWRPALCVAAAVAALAGAPASSEAAERPPKLDASAWVLVDASDGDTLAARSATSRRSIASATKLMTAYVALRELPLNRKVKAPAYQPSSPLESLAGLEAGERLSVRDLLYALLLESANDAAVTLADAVSGSVPKFVREMNRSAAALGLVHTSYENPIGLDAATNYSSASDLAELTLRLRRDGVFRRIVDTPEVTLETGNRPRQIDNRNLLVSRVPWVNGVKTGHTQQAGYVLVGSGTRKGTTLVSVVLGAPSEVARDAETLRLLDYGFSLYRSETVAAADEEVASPELRYQDTTLPLVAERELRISMRRGEKLDTEITAPDEVEGPIDRGEELGELTATIDGRDAGSVALVAARAADEATFFERARSAISAPIAVIVIAGVVILIAVAVLRRRSNRNRRGPEQRMGSHEERMRRRQTQTTTEEQGEGP